MDFEQILQLIDRLENSSLAELSYRDGEQKLTLRKAAAACPPPVPMPGPPVAYPISAPPPAASPTVQDAPVADAGTLVKAPLVGTFYAASAPEQPPFVKVGDRVRKGQPVCLLEAMKMMSEIPAPCDCEITAVLKENGALVSFGEPLFRYQPC